MTVGTRCGREVREETVERVVARLLGEDEDGEGGDEAPLPHASRGIAAFFFSSRRRHTRCSRDWSSDVCSSDLLIFKQGTDLLVARQRVQERLQQVRPTLPTWAAPPVMLPPVAATGRVLQIGMWSDHTSVMDMSVLAYFTLRPRILRVPGVSNVAIWNEQQPTLQVQMDPAKMAANNVAIEDVMTTTSDSLDTGVLKYSAGHVVGAGGWVDQ